MRSRRTAAFGSVGLVNVYKSGAGYGGSLLEVLDAVKDSREGSPLFRGQLFCNLIEIMEFQPDAWGLTFSPSARADAAKIRAIAGGPIESGDWLVRSKAAKWSEKLEQFFSSEKSTSYAKEAADTLGLVRTVANDGFHYIGYVGLDGKPVLTAAFPDGSAPAEMWGYDPASRRPARYAGAAMPLSPLFALPVSTAEYLAKAGVSRETPSLANTLPPLFRALKTP